MYKPIKILTLRTKIVFSCVCSLEGQETFLISRVTSLKYVAGLNIGKYCNKKDQFLKYPNLTGLFYDLFVGTVGPLGGVIPLLFTRFIMLEAGFDSVALA